MFLNISIDFSILHVFIQLVVIFNFGSNDFFSIVCQICYCQFCYKFSTLLFSLGNLVVVWW